MDDRRASGFPSAGAVHLPFTGRSPDPPPAELFGGGAFWGVTRRSPCERAWCSHGQGGRSPRHVRTEHGDSLRGREAACSPQRPSGRWCQASGLRNREGEAKVCCSATPGPVTRYGRVTALHLRVKDSGVPTTHGQGEQERKGSPRRGVGGRPACLDAQADRASGGRFESSFFQKSPWGLPDGSGDPQVWLQGCRGFSLHSESQETCFSP